MLGQYQKKTGNSCRTSRVIAVIIALITVQQFEANVSDKSMGKV